jgi:putative transposase
VVNEEKPETPVRFLCRDFGVPASSYYRWKGSAPGVRLLRKEEVSEAIKEIFKVSRETYGSPRINGELRENGIWVSENTVAKYMREMGLDARLKKRFRVMTTDAPTTRLLSPRESLKWKVSMLFRINPGSFWRETSRISD